MFPFDWFTDLEKLKQTEFTTIEEFYSHLKKKGITQETYDKMKDIFQTQCTNMGDYMDIYAKADVQDFPSAIKKVCEFYNSYGICPIKDHMSIPSISIKLMEKLTDDSTVWYLPPINASSVTTTLETGIVGGLAEVISFVFKHIR